MVLVDTLRPKGNTSVQEVLFCPGSDNLVPPVKVYEHSDLYDTQAGYQKATNEM